MLVIPHRYNGTGDWLHDVTCQRYTVSYTLQDVLHERVQNGREHMAFPLPDDVNIKKMLEFIR